MQVKVLIDKIYKDMEIHVCNHEKNPDVIQMANAISGFVNDKLVATDEKGDKVIISPQEIIRFYAQNQKVIAQDEKGIYSVHEKLYELEELLSEKSFIRISKSEIVNLRKIKKLDMNMLIEIIVRSVTGMEAFSPFSPEYMAMFPSDTLAVEVYILLHGLIGATFSGMMFIYEKPQIGFVMQNIIYVLGTGIVWIPIVTVIWQLYRYPSALIGTIGGFAVTYVIMSIVGYQVTKKEVEQINQFLEQTAE